MLRWIRRSKDGAQPEPAPVVKEPLTQAPLSLTDPAVIADFSNIAKDLRERRPVCPLATGGFLLTDPADVDAAFSNKSLSNAPSRFSALASKNVDKYVAASVASNIPPFLDAPRHIEIRKWLSAAFFKHFQEFQPEIAEISDAHFKAIPHGSAHLLVEEVARPYVVDVIQRFVGVQTDVATMKDYTAAIFRLFAPAQNTEFFAQTNAALLAARQDLLQALADRRTDKKPCLLNVLDGSFPTKTSAEQRDILIVDNALLMLADGVENVEAAIAQVMVYLKGLAERPSEIDADFVYQALQNDTPGQTIPRIAAKDITIGGTTAKAGTPIFLSLASANASNSQGKNYSFGQGRHRCIGENLAIETIHQFCAKLIHAGASVNDETLSYVPAFGHKWPRGVTLTLP